MYSRWPGSHEGVIGLLIRALPSTHASFITVVLLAGLGHLHGFLHRGLTGTTKLFAFARMTKRLEGRIDREAGSGLEGHERGLVP